MVMKNFIDRTSSNQTKVIKENINYYTTVLSKTDIDPETAKIFARNLEKEIIKLNQVARIDQSVLDKMEPKEKDNLLAINQEVFNLKLNVNNV